MPAVHRHYGRWMVALFLGCRTCNDTILYIKWLSEAVVLLCDEAFG
jgi:hypothetical protein